MKKLVGIVLVVVLLVSVLTGCSQPVNGTESPSSSAEETKPSESAAESKGADAVGDLKAVYDAIPDDKQHTSPDQIEFSKPDGEIKVGLAMLNVSTGFFKALADSLVEELEANGVTALLADCESDATKQVNQVENFITQGVDAIIINPADPQSALNIVLQKAFDEGIPVVSVDLPPDAGAPYMSAFITDAYQLGVLVGETSAQMLKDGKGLEGAKLGIIGGTEGNAIAAARNDGFRDGIAKVDTEGQIEEVSFLYAGAYSEESGLKTAENMLVAHPDIDILLGTCDAHVVGAYAAAKRQGVEEDIIMGGVDGSKPALEIMKNGGSIKAVALNSPSDVGKAAARSMIAYLVDGTKPASKTMVLEPAIVTPENVDKFYNPDSAF